MQPLRWIRRTAGRTADAVLSLVKLERYEDAVISLDRALEDDTANPELLTSKGYSLYRLKRYKESVEALGKSLKRRPQNPFTLLYRGKII